MLQDISEKMGSKKLLNTSSSPPIAYKRYSNNCDEQTPLQQQISEQQQQQQQQQLTGNNRANNNNSNNNINNTTTTCLLVKHNTTNNNKMFTKLRNCFTQFRTKSSSSLAATSQNGYSQQPRKHQHQQQQHYRHEKLTESSSIPMVQSSTSNMLNLVCITVTLVFLASINSVTASPVFVDNPSLAQFQSGRNIRHLPCIVRKSGRSGVCMFAIDCIKQNGTHLGTCIDRFYFGSCCDIKEQELTEIADNSIDQNTISHHFTPDSSTVPTSALFKLTTLSPEHEHENSSTASSSSSSALVTSSSTVTPAHVTQLLNSATQTLASSSNLNDTPKPTTMLITSSTDKPVKSSTTERSNQQQTAHKQSHFVIRTTAKPTKYTAGLKPSHNTVIKKRPTTTTTTSKRPVTTTTTTKAQVLLTTTETAQQQDELAIEATTTQPTKLFTYQIVETTPYTPTEVTNILDFVTTERPQQKITKTPQATTTTQPKHKETEAATEAVTTHRINTVKPKPQTTRKPTTSKKPTSVKRTTTKPTRRPTITSSSSTTTTTTIATTQNYSELQMNSTTELQSLTDSTVAQSSTTMLVNKTTLSPRPRPKPTASIVKVPKPVSTTSTKPTSSSSTTTTQTSTTTESERVAATTTPSSTTKLPVETTTATSTTKTTIIITTTTPRPSATTTHKVTHKPVLTSTTHKPGLVTWTNIDGEPMDPNQPIISEWIPITSQAPLNTSHKVEETSSENVTFEEMDVSVSSSVTAVMNNTTVIISPPHKPIHLAKPSSTTTTDSPATTTSTTTTTTTTFKPTTSTSPPTETLIESSSLAESSTQFTTEGLSPSTTASSIISSTEDVTTENSNLNATSTTPFAGLEGVDYRQVCGRRMFPEPRIVGGSNAAFGRWPWQISLRQWRTSTYLHKCGAALLNENWAITAAHCVDNVPPSDLLLRLGEYDLAEEEEPYGYQERRVQIVASHPQFDPRTFEYDLALLRFYEPVVFQPNIIPVCVPENDENFIGQTAFVTGWGRLYEDGPLPSVLQEVAVPVINNTICESMYRAAGYIEHIPHIFICAGWKKGGYDSCEGDSGGPMVLQRESDKRFQLGGVISWGIGCAEANQPGVYTRISEFRDWINQILQF